MDDVIQSAWFEAIGRTNILSDPEAQKRFEICTHGVLYDRKNRGRAAIFAAQEDMTLPAARSERKRRLGSSLKTMAGPRRLPRPTPAPASRRHSGDACC